MPVPVHCLTLQTFALLVWLLVRFSFRLLLCPVTQREEEESVLASITHRLADGNQGERSLTALTALLATLFDHTDHTVWPLFYIRSKLVDSTESPLYCPTGHGNGAVNGLVKFVL